MESTLVMVPRGMEIGCIERFLYAGLVIAEEVGEGWLADGERRFDGFRCVTSHDRIALLNHPRVNIPAVILVPIEATKKIFFLASWRSSMTP
jgi:hypothetical protein